MIMTLKGILSCFFLHSPHCAVNCLQYLVTLKWPLCNHLQITTYLVFLVCHMLCAMWYEGTAQLLSLTVEIKFTLALFSG